MNGGDDLVDLAAGRRWTRLDAAGAPVEDEGAGGGPDDPSGAIQGGVQIDLGLRFPIHGVRVAAAHDAALPPGAGPRLAFSDDGAAWSEAPVAPDDGQARDTMSIAVAPGQGSWARHVRVTADGEHGARIEAASVWCAGPSFDLIALRRVMGADFAILHEHAEADAYHAYSAVRGERAAGRSLVGVAVYENGAFGNCIVQYILAVGVARHLNLRYVKLPANDRSGMIAPSGPLDCGDIVFIPGADPLPPGGYLLSGLFFDLSIQRLAGAIGPLETRAIVRRYVRPLFNRLPAATGARRDDELLIHIRSGDIFSTWIAPLYPQPPLAFYRMVVERLRAEGRIRSVKLVFENRLNPVIEELELHLARVGMAFTVQSGTLAEDVAALLEGRYLAFGLGTFGPGICHLSERVGHVFYFSSGSPQQFRQIATIERVVEVIDVAGAYTKAGEWDNSPARRALMIDYPIENLAFDDVIG